MDKLRLLIAENDKSTQDFYNDVLADDLFNKRIADNGLDALETYRLWNPDILLLKLKIPLKTGFDVLQKIREKEPVSTKTDKDKSKVRIIIMVADDLDFDDDLKDCFNLGINSYLMQPLRPYTLQKSIMNTYLNVKE